MSNDHTTLYDYNSLLTSHIEDVAQFNSDTHDWLSSPTAANIFFEEASNRIVSEQFGLLKDKLSNRQKILVTIKEIANSSKSYLDRLFAISGVLSALIKVVGSE
jgi:hypothetical protein